MEDIIANINKGILGGLKKARATSQLRTDAMCNQGKDHPCPLNVNGGYCCAEECQFMVFPIKKEING